MARQNKITDSGMTESEIMNLWNQGGEKRQELVELLGFASANGLYNALRACGYIPGGPVSGNAGNGEKRASKGGSVKIIGCLPYKVQKRIERLLNLDEDADQPGWSEWKLCEQADVNFEGFTMVKFAGGEESEGGKSYRAWIDSNRAADKAAEEAAVRAADPMFQLKAQLSRYAARIVERDIEIKNLKEELESAKRASSTRGVHRGGELTAEGLKLLKQRFHPDKQNGNDPALYTAVMQWLNAIVL